MATRPTWQGHLRLSLVTCPVALYTATSTSGDIRFNLLHKDTHNRIKMVTTDPELGPVERKDLVKGYEIEKGRYVVVTEDEIKGVRLETTKTIDIERFVNAADIDRLYWNDPYYLVPDGKLAVDAYAVIREAMARQERMAIGRVVLHQRERLLAIEPRDDGLVAYSLRTFDEVRKPEDYFASIPEAKPDAAMVEIAEKIIDQLEGPFDPTKFNDHYEQALRKLIQDKEKGRTVTVSEPKEAEVIDLMEALRRSLGQDAKPRRGETPPKGRKPAAKPAARRKPAAKKRA